MSIQSQDFPQFLLAQRLLILSVLKLFVTKDLWAVLIVNGSKTNFSKEKSSMLLILC